jgi:hypothetical protein
LAFYVEGRTEVEGIREWSVEEDIFLSDIEEVAGRCKNLLNKFLHDICSSLKVIFVY